MRNVSFLMLISCLSVACTSEININPPSQRSMPSGALETAPVNQVVLGKYGAVGEKKEAEADAADSILAVSSDGRITISTVPDEIVSSELGGCGCGFYPAKDKSSTIIGWLEQESPEAIMKINGNLERFALNHERNQRAAGDGGRPESGDKTTFQLSNAKYEAVVECRIADTCWGEEGCESIDYKCSITTKSADGSLTIPAVGTCGC